MSTAIGGQQASTGQQASSASLEPPAQPWQDEAVTVSFSDSLTDRALEEQINVAVDGQMVGSRSADLDNSWLALSRPAS